MKKLYVLFLISIGVNAAPSFNALPESAEYNEQLCQATKDEYQRFNSELKIFDNSIVPKDRESWVIDYVVTEELRDNALSQYKTNC